jgi:hypothetical protein
MGDSFLPLECKNKKLLMRLNSGVSNDKTKQNDSGGSSKSSDSSSLVSSSNFSVDSCFKSQVVSDVESEFNECECSFCGDGLGIDAIIRYAGINQLPLVELNEK